ncbi:MAG: tripartite tricarboxylate transporter substrate-binding protein [Deltaproteobacteria bacterium]|nr:tripartite tricarboxylate transporter substrate-binding protein [Deltaproteobacteria bacterium]
MKQKSWSLVAMGIVALLLTVVAKPTLAAEDYKGKKIRFIVGSAAGGGYDTYTRMIARHIGRYIPGKPTTVVENMEGAGGLVAANYIYKRAAPDGLTAAVFNNSNIVQKALGDPRINIDFQKLGWIGAPSVGAPMCMIMGFTGLKTLDDVLKSTKPLKMGANRAGTTGYDLPLILNQTLGTKFDVISGYTGTSKIRVALQAHEIDGMCSNWESMRVTARSMLDAKGDSKLIPFVISDKWEDPEVKDLPLFKNVIKDPKKFEIFRAWADQMEFQRPLSLPPGTPKERLEILRKALAEVLQDKALLEEATKSKLVITHVSGERTAKLVEEILSMPADAKKSLAFLVRTQKN